ncbi:MAG: BspA family leucine-rich repeat surface protein, partial [Erysipelotrichaceae bacterium]|nr:BspA family leucine-rich repeat surface protein [Erysipelotrichaceae bacterium]
MKRFLSVFLSLLLLFTTVMSSAAKVYADDTEVTGDEETVEVAAEEDEVPEEGEPADTDENEILEITEEGAEEVLPEEPVVYETQDVSDDLRFDGKAYAVLTADGDFIFFRSTYDYEEGYEGNVYDVVGTWSSNGKVFNDPEGDSITPSWFSNDEIKSQVKSIKVKDGYGIRPNSMSHWFNGFTNLESADLSQFDTSNVTNMARLFAGCSNLKTVTLGSNFDTSNVTNMLDMFDGCSSLEELDVSGFNTANVTDMEGMFRSCESLTSLDVTGFRTSNVTTMKGMFSNCKGLASLNVSGFDTGSVTDMCEMFNTCSGLTSLDLSNFTTYYVTDMGYMFSYCQGLTELNLEVFNTQNVTNMQCMFANCYNLESLDISNFKTTCETGMYNLFYRCNKLNRINLGEDFVWSDGAYLPAGSWTNGYEVYSNTELYSAWNGALAGVWTKADPISALHIYLGGHDVTGQTVNADGPFDLSVHADPYGASEDVTWESSDPSIATVDRNGLVTKVKNGTVKITATSTVDDNIKATTTFKFINFVQNIEIDEFNTVLCVGKTATITAKVSNSDATDKTLRWSVESQAAAGHTVDDPDQPTVATIDQKGKVKALYPGYATIKVEAADGSGVANFCNVEVHPLATGVEIDLESVAWGEGEISGDATGNISENTYTVESKYVELSAKV